MLGKLRAVKSNAAARGRKEGEGEGATGGNGGKAGGEVPLKFK